MVTLDVTWMSYWRTSRLNLEWMKGTELLLLVGMLRCKQSPNHTTHRAIKPSTKMQFDDERYHTVTADLKSRVDDFTSGAGVCIIIYCKWLFCYLHAYFYCTHQMKVLTLQSNIASVV